MNERVFKVGFAKADITPPLGTFMSGYYVDRFAKSVLDPLYVVMLAFSDGGRTALLAQLDTMALSTLVAGRMRDAIAAATGIPREAILLHASHTHDGGQLNMAAFDGPAAQAEALTKCFPKDVEYFEYALGQVVAAARDAVADLRPARFSSARTKAERISFGRRYLMKDGRVVTNPGTNNPGIVRAVGTADDTVQVLRIDRDGAKAISVINFQTHPDVVGGETVTADWPGLTRDVFEAATFGRTSCIVINGTQGDVNHCNVLPRPGELNGLKRDFDDCDRGYAHAQHMANVLAGAALSVWEKCAPLASGDLYVGGKTVVVPAQKARDADEKNLAWAEAVLALQARAGDAAVTARYGWTGMELTTEVARAGRIRAMADHDDNHYVPLYLLAFGDIAFAGFPGEPFNDIGVAIRRESPFPLTVLACLVNGCFGYFPFSDSYEQGGYESATSPFGPTVADDLIAGALDMLRAARARHP